MQRRRSSVRGFWQRRPRRHGFRINKGYVMNIRVCDNLLRTAASIIRKAGIVMALPGGLPTTAGNDQ
jgi:hypothetical protein